MFQDQTKLVIVKYKYLNVNRKDEQEDEMMSF